MTQPFGFIRRIHGIPLQKIADYAGCSVGLIHEVENCKRSISEDLKSKISEALKIAIIEDMKKDKLFFQVGEELVEI